jgi:hypothetical protein
MKFVLAAFLCAAMACDQCELPPHVPKIPTNPGGGSLSLIFDLFAAMGGSHHHRHPVAREPRRPQCWYFEVRPTFFVGKCPIGLPLTNAQGTEYYCGPGKFHQDCPAQSECTVGPNDKLFFHTCCAIAAPAGPVLATSSSLFEAPLNSVLVAKCPVGSPLKNVAGQEFDCSSTVCPLGSECVVGPRGVYYACCSIPLVVVKPYLMFQCAS